MGTEEGVEKHREAKRASCKQSPISHSELLPPPWQLRLPVRFQDDVEGGDDVSIDGRGRRNATDVTMLARDDAREHRRSRKSCSWAMNLSSCESENEPRN